WLPELVDCCSCGLSCLAVLSGPTGWCGPVVVLPEPFAGDPAATRFTPAVVRTVECGSVLVRVVSEGVVGSGVLGSGVVVAGVVVAGITGDEVSVSSSPSDDVAGRDSCSDGCCDCSGCWSDCSCDGRCGVSGARPSPPSVSCSVSP